MWVKVLVIMVVSGALGTIPKDREEELVRIDIQLSYVLLPETVLVANARLNSSTGV